MEATRKIFSLAQLNQSLENHFFKAFSEQNFWITAELMRINEKNGHFYLELADNSKGKTTARSQGVIWASRYQSIMEEIGLQELSGILKPGNKILFNVKIEFHAIYGLKLKIRHIDPSYSYGEIERKRQENIKRLKKEGLFYQQQAIKLPVIIKRIALIGSPDTSGYRDFLDEIFNNHDFRNFVVKDFPVRVQGNIAAKEIVRAFEMANQFDAEVIILLRGGGSKMDLAIFDDYGIAKAICLSRLPVLTGIGHETDEVVADLVARMHFITPTAVGRHLQYAIQSFKAIIREYHDKGMHLAQQRLAQGKEEFYHLNNYLTHYSRAYIQFYRSVFQEYDYQLYEAAQSLLFQEKTIFQQQLHLISMTLKKKIQQHNYWLERILSQIKGGAIQIVEREKLFKINQYENTFCLLGTQQIEKERLTLENYDELLKLLNPLKILASGYTISTINNVDLNKNTPKIADEMKTLSAHYMIISEITEIKIKEDENNG